MTTILNVDDNQASRYLRSQTLRQAGYKVLEARTGEEALSIVRETSPAMVILDVNLPDISGLDVCRKIKTDPDASAIPVLHISATAVGEQDLITGLQAADAYVVEPVPPEVLLAFVGAMLRGSELLRQWVGVFDALADGVALLSGDGIILRCNSTFCRLLGKRPGELLGHSISEAMSAISCDPDRLVFRRSQTAHQTETAECQFGDKTYRLSSHLALVKGSLAGAIYIASDITEEKRAAREKEDALALLRSLTDGAPMGFAFFDRDVRYRLVNKELAKKNGMSVEAHIGRTPEEILPTRAEEIRTIFEEVVKTGRPLLGHEVALEGKSGQGTSYWSENWYPVHSDDGRLIGVGATIVETTAQKLAERERQEFERRILDAQKLESVGLLAGGIAHDFNNLLTGILGNAGLALEMSEPGSSIAFCLEEITKASERAAHLTNQMLAYSGKGQFFIETLDLSRETEAVVQLVRASVSKKIHLDLDLPEGLPGLRADKGQLQQVVMNIVVNGAEAIGDNLGWLTVKTCLKQVSRGELRNTITGAAIEPGQYVCLDVRDTGCGMDDGTLRKIFDPFFTTKFTGRGLGLAAVGGIIRSHNGAIHVSTTPGKGSTFQVYFPVVEEQAPVTRPPAGRRSAWPAGVALKRTILLVDDEQVVLRPAQSALERLGCHVLTAESGPEAIEVFSRHAAEISLVILDLSMPGISGLEVLPELRKIRDDIDVIISSGYNETETLRLFEGMELSGFLQKPYSAQSLTALVQTVIIGKGLSHSG